MPATKKTTKKNNTNTKGKKAEKTEQKSETMTYGQARALTGALYHVGHTKAEVSDFIDKAQAKYNIKPAKPMPADKKAKWLEEHGNEPATWGQCSMYAMTLFEAKISYAAVSKIIESLDEKNGYKREPKAEAKAEEPVAPIQAQTAQAQVQA